MNNACCFCNNIIFDNNPFVVEIEVGPEKFPVHHICLIKRDASEELDFKKAVADRYFFGDEHAASSVMKALYWKPHRETIKTGWYA